MFVFEFADPLFAFAYTQPPFAFALLFARPTTRQKGFLPFASPYPYTWHGLAYLLKPFCGRSRSRILGFIVNLVLVLKFSTEGKATAAARARVRRPAARERIHATTDRVRVVARTPNDTPS